MTFGWWFDFVLAVVGFACGWVLAEMLGGRYDPAQSGIVDGGT
jgi:hypothetical protein